MSGCGARTAAGSLEAVFRVVGCGAFRLDFDGGLGGEAEETALFLPVMRQVFAQSQQPARKRDRNPCDRPPPTGAAAKHAEGSLYHFGFSQGLIQKVHNFFKIMLYRHGASSARLRAISRSQRSPFAKSRSLS